MLQRAPGGSALSSTAADQSARISIHKIERKLPEIEAFRKFATKQSRLAFSASSYHF
jgi:hypothetical protein